MSEVIATGAGYMYDEVQAIQDLNKVEGFDPRKYMRLIGVEGQPGKYYLDVAYRKLWFRLKHPEGKIVKRLLKLTENVAIVEARVYLNRNDEEDNFISNALAQKYLTADEQFGNKFVELAETAAVGRALADAGFGLQFADKEGDMDPEVTDAPFDARMIMGEANPAYGDTLTEGVAEEGFDMNGYAEAGAEQGFADLPDNESDMIPGQFGIESYIPMPNAPENSATQQMNQNQMARQQRAAAQQQSSGARQQAQQNTAQSRANQAAAKPSVQQSTQRAAQPSKAQPAVRKDMPVEQIYSMLNPETAAAVVVNIGFNKGKTLGQVAMEKPASLDWYVSSYEGPDNLLRAAAKYLMDAALQKAS